MACNELSYLGLPVSFFERSLWPIIILPTMGASIRMFIVVTC